MYVGVHSSIETSRAPGVVDASASTAVIVVVVGGIAG